MNTRILFRFPLLLVDAAAPRLLWADRSSSPASRTAYSTVHAALLGSSSAALCLHIFIAGRFNSTLKSGRDGHPSFARLINNAIPHAASSLANTDRRRPRLDPECHDADLTVIIAHSQPPTKADRREDRRLDRLAGTVLLFSPHIAAKADVPLWALALPVVAPSPTGFAAIFASQHGGDRVDAHADPAVRMTSATQHDDCRGRQCPRR